ncbi:hypothetical protein SFC65_24180 [Priestia filamentosa]|uniref:hypothetical protein n=1 Tax=Priestia filamentosa TaxID=1402861 RepID=UPI003982A777
MRLYVSNTKDQIIFLLFDFLLATLLEKEVKLIFNERSYEGTISKIQLDEEEYEYIEFTIGEKAIKFPFVEDSKVRLDKGLFYFETRSNTILIYV